MLWFDVCSFLLLQLGNNRWYEFDDNNVFPVDWEKIKTSAAYVLFYRRISLNDIE